MLSRVIFISAVDKVAPTLVSSEIGNNGTDVLALTLDSNVTVSDVVGISISASGGAVTVDSVISGSETSTVLFQLSRIVTGAETASLTIGYENQIFGINGSSCKPTVDDIVINSPIPVVPTLDSASISDDSLFLNFDVDVNISGITGITLVSDGGSLSVLSIRSGNGTDIIELLLNRTPLETETITLTIDSNTNLIYSVYANIHFDGVTDEPVIVPSGVEYFDETTYFDETIYF